MRPSNIRSRRELVHGCYGTLPAANLPAPGGGGPPGGLAALTSSTGGLGNGETTVVSYLIPGGTNQAGTTYRIRAFGTCSSRSEEHTSELQSPCNLVCRLLLEKKKQERRHTTLTYSSYRPSHYSPHLTR